MALFKRISLAGSLAALLLTGLSVSAFASTATVATNVNVRSGPGVDFVKVATLPAGYRVDMGQCRGSWCQVHAGGVYGWVSARYLRASDARRARNYAPRPAYNPRSQLDIVIHSYPPLPRDNPFWDGPMDWRRGGHWYPHRPHRRHWIPVQPSPHPSIPIWGPGPVIQPGVAPGPDWSNIGPARKRGHYAGR